MSLEWPVYRPARVAAIRALQLGQGEAVLDVGCGTGLSFELLLASVGPSGSVTGVDASASMLAAARRRSAGRPVRLVQADAPALDDVLGVAPRFDAAISTYSLSLMPRWEAAWEAMRALVRPGGRIAVVDLDVPADAGAAVQTFARAACALGGSDPRRTPWRRVEEELDDVVASDHVAGHVRVRVGTVPSPGR